MPRILTREEAQDFLAERHVAVLSVASDDARPPLTIPIWYHSQPGGDLSFFTGTAGRKARKTRLIRKAGVVSLCMQREAFPYRYVTVEGAVVQIDRPPTAEQTLANARRYLPEEMAQGFVAGEIANPAGTFELFMVRPERWLSFDFGEEG